MYVNLYDCIIQYYIYIYYVFVLYHTKYKCGLNKKCVKKYSIIFDIRTFTTSKLIYIQQMLLERLDTVDIVVLHMDHHVHLHPQHLQMV